MAGIKRRLRQHHGKVFEPGHGAFNSASGQIDKHGIRLGFQIAHTEKGNFFGLACECDADGGRILFELPCLMQHFRNISGVKRLCDIAVNVIAVAFHGVFEACGEKRDGNIVYKYKVTVSGEF